MKNWKSNPTGGVYVQWDNGDKNVYRYGAENCYDVIVYSLSSICVNHSVNPMLRDDFVYPEGLNNPSESISRIVCFYI